MPGSFVVIEIQALRRRVWHHRSSRHSPLEWGSQHRQPTRGVPETFMTTTQQLVCLEGNPLSFTLISLFGLTA